MASRPPDEPERDAFRRWTVIQVMRIGGVAFAVLGLLMTQDAVVIAGEANRRVGYVLLALGLLDAFVVPTVLARKWRSPRE